MIIIKKCYFFLEIKSNIHFLKGLYLKLAAFDTNCETLPNVAAVEAERMGLSRGLLKAAAINARQLAEYLHHLRSELVDIDDSHRKDKELIVGILGEVLNCLRTGVNLSGADLQVKFFPN